MVVIDLDSNRIIQALEISESFYNPNNIYMRYEDFFYLIGRTNFPKIGIVARISVYDLFSNKDVPLYYQKVNTTHYRLEKTKTSVMTDKSDIPSGTYTFSKAEHGNLAYVRPNNATDNSGVKDLLTINTIDEVTVIGLVSGF